MANEIYKNDPVLEYIDETINKIENESEMNGERKIPSREDLLNTHLAFIKVKLMLH